MTAPSADNSQPFTFRWADGALEVQHCATRARHALNVRGQVSALALGCTVEALRLGAQLEGLAATIGVADGLTERLVDVEGPSVCAVATFEPLAEPSDPLASVLFGRCTDRRPYPPAPPPPIDTLRAGMGPVSPAIALGLLPPDDPEILRILGTGEGWLWQVPGAFADALRWIDFSGRADDGMPIAGLGLPAVSWPALKALKARPEWTSLLPVRASQLAMQATLRHQLRHSSAIVAIGTRRRDDTALVEVGRVALRAWLWLTARRWAAQPITLTCLSAWYRALGHGAIGGAALPADGLQNARKIGQIAGFRPDILPAWLLRIGPAPRAPMPARAPRRSENAVLHR